MYSQEAIAVGLEQELTRLDRDDCYLKSLVKELESKRDLIVKILKDVGMNPIIPESGYFILADWSPLGTLHFAIIVLFIT